MKKQMLTLLKDRVSKKGRYYMSLYLCECGKETEKYRHNVVSGRTVSCGCLKPGSRKSNGKNKTHGLSSTREYGILSGMKQRCYNPNAINYKHYGNKGITVCDEWSKENGIVNFINDMGYSPTDKHSIDRIDPKKGYYKENCRWVETSEQLINRTSYGKSDFIGVSYCKFSSKYKYQIVFDGVTLFSAYFSTELEAAMAREIEILKNNLPHKKNFE